MSTAVESVMRAGNERKVGEHTAAGAELSMSYPSAFQSFGSGPVHLVGIGGAGMSGIARLLLSRGVTVTGSDAKDGPVPDELRRLGAHVSVGHAAGNVGGATRVVYTAAVKEDNPELKEARRLGIDLVSRAVMLGELMDGAASIAIAGTHGKTTTTGMIASIFEAAGADPS